MGYIACIKRLNIFLFGALVANLITTGPELWAYKRGVDSYTEDELIGDVDKSEISLVCTDGQCGENPEKFDWHIKFFDQYKNVIFETDFKTFPGIFSPYGVQDVVTQYEPANTQMLHKFVEEYIDKNGYEFPNVEVIYQVDSDGNRLDGKDGRPLKAEVRATFEGNSVTVMPTGNGKTTEQSGNIDSSAFKLFFYTLLSPPKGSLRFPNFPSGVAQNNGYNGFAKFVDSAKTKNGLPANVSAQNCRIEGISC